ncbi:MAG: carbon storage regulator CsrA [Acetivibrionales bacterium]|jgi:carbon storage regulator
MLVLTRKRDQSIVINENIEITVLDIQGDQVRIGIDAPREVSIHRKEVFVQISEENRKAASANVKVDLKEVLKNSRLAGLKKEDGSQDPK